MINITTIAIIIILFFTAYEDYYEDDYIKDHLKKRIYYLKNPVGGYKYVQLRECKWPIRKTLEERKDESFSKYEYNFIEREIKEIYDSYSISILDIKKENYNGRDEILEYYNSKGVIRKGIIKYKGFEIFAFNWKREDDIMDEIDKHIITYHVIGKSFTVFVVTLEEEVKFMIDYCVDNQK